MRDRDIRLALRDRLRAQHSEEPDTLIVEEVGLAKGSSRIDLVVINGALNGFEIKSEADTLARLPSQAVSYGAVFDTVTLVLADKHRADADALIPAWWGVTLATSTTGGTSLQAVRPVEPNPSQDPFAIASLLWHEEALQVLERHALSNGVRSKPRRFAWLRLADRLPPEVLKAEVRAMLKARGNWRAGRERTRDGDLSPRSSR